MVSQPELRGLIFVVPQGGRVHSALLAFRSDDAHTRFG
jgi:hypothetical protein